MACIGAYLSKQMAFDNTILECINFLDHAMRMMPSET
jgi:eukaryotic translation initiation factor 2C